jgi:hypothetical protein
LARMQCGPRSRRIPLRAALKHIVQLRVRWRCCVATFMSVTTQHRPPAVSWTICWRAMPRGVRLDQGPHCIRAAHDASPSAEILGPDSPTMACRTPPKRAASSPVDEAKLQAALKDHVEAMGVTNSFRLGRYHTVSKDQAVDGHALAECHDLVTRLLSALPTGECNYRPMRTAASFVLGLWPKANREARGLRGPTARCRNGSTYAKSVFNQPNSSAWPVTSLHQIAS